MWGWGPPLVRQHTISAGPGLQLSRRVISTARLVAAASGALELGARQHAPAQNSCPAYAKFNPPATAMVWALSEPGKTTPKAGLTLLSREDGNLKFVHSPSASGDVSLKHKLGQKLTLGVGFTVSVALLWGAYAAGGRIA